MKGLQLLVFLRDSAKPLSLTAISRGLGFNKVSALRILLTLERHRFVEKDPRDKTYKIGSNAFYVGSGFIAGGKREKILKAMANLVHDLKHTITLGVLAVTTGAAYLMMRRLFTVSETALAGVRTRTFAHIHDLSMLHQQAERRGALVSRVTSDTDQITQFLQWGGVILLISFGQIAVTTVVMAVYSWQLTLVVLASFLPVIIVIRVFQRRLADAYGAVRKRVGAMLSIVGESVVGAEVIRAYGVADRTSTRLDDAVTAHRQAQTYALRTSVTFVSQASLDNGSVPALGLAKPLVAVSNTRRVGKKDMKLNDALPKIEVDPESYEVRADGELLTCAPAERVPLSRRYSLF